MAKKKATQPDSMGDQIAQAIALNGLDGLIELRKEVNAATLPEDIKIRFRLEINQAFVNFAENNKTE